ncbi:glycosyltransferase family 39 protein [Saccharothrix saharensis]|uniref:glycosyltransferase family 39 protein n=1 Tax=Saccharothrix saharensis TaxID=571190 RepID=UPI003673EF35
MPRPGLPDQRATEGVTVVMPVRGDHDFVAAVHDLVSTLDRAGERHRVLLVLADDSPVTAARVAEGLADRYPDRVTTVRRDPGRGAGAVPGTDLAVALAEHDHRRILLTDGRLAAARLPGLLAAARRERADLVVGYRCDGAGPPRPRVSSRSRAPAEPDPTALPTAELLTELRRRDARVLTFAVRQGPGGDDGGPVHPVEVGHVTGASPPRDPLLRAVLLAAVVLSVGACAVVAWTQTTLAYPDAVSHLLITRRVLDASTPGAAQLGGVWLPLSHVLALPLVVNESWYHSGVVPSAVSMCAYVATAGWLYRIGFALTGRRAGGLTAALVFCANPNVLYLQSTPMTEALLLACLAAATWHLLRWCRDGDYRQLVATAVAVLGATLVRYEGWAFLPAVAVVVGVCSWRRSRAKAEPWVLVRADLVFFGCLAVSGVVGWAVWNAAIFGDPLNFVRGEFAKPALWVGADERAVGDWVVSLSTYLHAVRHDLGPVVLVSAGAGLVCLTWRTRLRDGAAALLPLLVFLPFFVWALHSGQRPLHVPEIGGDLYNVRFALVMVLPAALFTAYLVVPANRALLRSLPAVAVLVGCGHLALTGIATLEEARAFRAGSAQRVDARAAAWLREHYDGGRVLMQSWSNETVGFDSRVPVERVVYEGSFRQWEPALDDPVGQGIRWIHLRRTPGGEDEVWRRLHDSPLMHFEYKPAYADDHHIFYRRADSPGVVPAEVVGQ